MAEARRGVHEAPSVLAEDFHHALGRAYVDAATASTSRTVLDESRRAVLAAWVETLIPGNEHWPSASETNALGYIDATIFAAPELRCIVLLGIDRLEALGRESHGEEKSFADLSSDQRRELLTRLEALNPERAFELVLELTFEAYYRDEQVLAVLERRTGFSAQEAMHGREMEPFDAAVLDRVRALPPRYRRLDDEPAGKARRRR
jgi:hypothetical protein